MKWNGAQPLAAPFFFGPRRCAGFSLLELTVVIAIAGTLIFFAVRTYQPKEALALQQVERLRNDLRHVQMLAITWSQPLRVTTAAGSYSISCVTASAIPPCNASPVIDPATRAAYTVNLEPGLSLGGPGFTLDFDALGRPKNGAVLTAANATYTIAGGGVTRNVIVAPLTGFVTAQ